MRLKRVISAALAVSMAVSMMPATAVSAFAAGTSADTSISTPSQAETKELEVKSFTSGQLKEAVEKAAKEQGITDLKTISTLVISGGTLGATDFEYLSGVHVSGDASNRWRDSDFKPYDASKVELSNMVNLDLSGIENNEIPARAFNGNTKIEKIILPENLNRIGLCAFAAMTNLTYLSTDANVNLRFDGLRIMGESIAFGDKGLTDELVLPESLERLSPSAFEESSVKGDIKINGNVDIHDNIDVDAAGTFPTGKRIFFHTNIQSLTFQSGIEEICEKFAYHCESLKSVTFADTVRIIGNAAFAGSGLTGDLVIPESVEKIEEDAFNRAPVKAIDLGDIGLSNIIVENKDAKLQLSKRAFANLKYGTKLYFMSAIENPTTTADKYWYDSQVIVLNTNGGTVKSNSTTDAKTGLYIPEKTGYTFAGWYDNAGLTGEAVTTPVTGKTYYAKWTKNKYTVTLNNNGHGEQPAAMPPVEHGASVTDLPKKLSDSTNEWVFTGWYTDAECTTEYKNEPITKAITLYAGWRKYTNTSLTAKVSKSDYLVNTPADVNVTVTPGDDFSKLMQDKDNIKISLTYDDDVTSVMLNGEVLDKKEYTISELMPLMGQNRKLDVTYGKAGTHTFSIVLKNGDKIVSKCSTNIVVAEEAAELTPATKLYTLTVKNADVTIKNGDEEIKAEKNDKGELIAKVPEKADVTVTYTSQSDAVAFDQWTITTDETLDVDVKNNPLKFQMPAGGVTIEAMTKDASIEEDEPNILGTAAVVGTAAAGTAILAWQGYQLGTELYLKTALPAGTAIPTNRAELALLVWNHAGKPAPAAVLPADATDTQKAIAWAVENDLLKAAKDNGETYVDTDSVSRVEVIRVWNKAQEK